MTKKQYFTRRGAKDRAVEEAIQMVKLALTFKNDAGQFDESVLECVKRTIEKLEAVHAIPVKVEWKDAF